MEGKPYRAEFLLQPDDVASVVVNALRALGRGGHAGSPLADRRRRPLAVGSEPSRSNDADHPMTSNGSASERKSLLPDSSRRHPASIHDPGRGNKNLPRRPHQPAHSSR
jgi:hypothetical protein